MADDDKTEEPTSKKIEDARNEGNIAKSAEVSGAVVLTLGTAYLLFFSSYSMMEIKKLMLFSYSFIGQELDGPLFYAITNQMIIALFKALAPLFILVIVLSLVSNWFQFGFLAIPIICKTNDNNHCYDISFYDNLSRFFIYDESRDFCNYINNVQINILFCSCNSFNYYYFCYNRFLFYKTLLYEIFKNE